MWVLGVGGGHLGLNGYLLPNSRMEAVNAKIQGRSTPFSAKRGAVNFKYLFSLYFMKYMAFIVQNMVGVKAFGSLLSENVRFFLGGGGAVVYEP